MGAASAQAAAAVHSAVLQSGVVSSCKRRQVGLSPVYIVPMKQRAITVLACVLLATAGCKQEQTRRTPQSQADSRIRAVQQAEMQRAAQQRQAPQDQPPPSPNAPQTGGAQPASGAPATGQAQPPPGPQYLPPSEQGAYVEMTETPAGSPPPSPSAAPPPASPNAGAPTGGAPGGPAAAATAGGAGGTMPGLPPTAGAPPPGAGAPPPAASVGKLAPGGPPPAAVSGAASAPVQTRAAQVGALNSELERKMKEFDELMKRAQAEADRERAALGAGSAASRSGKPGGGGGLLEPPPDEFGSGGAANRATGIGASPDLSGDTSADSARRGGPSAVRGIDEADEDIVARQLREAAQRETDPVLREKLWAEYRQYKGQ